MQLINYFFESLWGFALRLVGFVLCIWIILQALRSLFDEHKLGRRVRLGVANQRIVMRTVEWSASALLYSAIH